MDKKAIQHLRGIKDGKIRNLDGIRKKEMEYKNGQPGAIAKRPSAEKVNHHINDILHVEADKIPEIIRSYAEWSARWE